MASFITWFVRAIMFGTIIMYGSMGEIFTEKSGNLNLGVPGIMYLGGFAGFASTYIYETKVENPNAFVCLLLGLVCGFIAAAIGGLIYSFLTITLRANQNVTGLALTTFGTGIANFFGTLVIGKNAVSVNAHFTNSVFSARIPWLSEKFGKFGEMFFSYGFMVYLAIIIAVLAQIFLNKTRTGLNLRAVGESPATADAAGINVVKYKYLATCIGAGVSGLGGVFYVLDYNRGIWATTDQIEALGWLAVALVIFTTWKPKNAIWGGYLFGFLYWTYQYLHNFISVSIPGYATFLLQMIPYIVTIVVLVVVSLRKKRENQPPASLGLSYFREDR